MEIRVNSDVAVSILSFKAKEAQWVDNIDAVDAAQLQKEGYNVQLVGLWFVHGLVPDTTNPDSPYQDPKVRMAVEYALDRETMAQIGKGFYKAPYQVAGPEYAWYNPSLTPRKYDPAKAKQLLAQAGYPKGFTYPLYTDVRQRKDFMVAVQTYLKEAGIDAPLEVADVAKATSWQYTTGWKGLFMQGGGNFTQTLISYDTNLMNPTNWVSFKRPQGWQDMWSTVVSEPDHDKRYAKMSQMVKILYDEALVIPYQYDTPIYVTSNNLHDVRWQQGGIGHWWDCSSVWLSK
jgi:peptide/nickel transport system substrate-binding protein